MDLGCAAFTAALDESGLRPEDVVVQAVLGRVGPGDTLADPSYHAMSYVGPGEWGTEVFAATTPLSLAGSVGYTVRVLPHHWLLAGDSELGLVSLA